MSKKYSIRTDTSLFSETFDEIIKLLNELELLVDLTDLLLEHSYMLVGPRGGVVFHVFDYYTTKATGETVVLLKPSDCVCSFLAALRARKAELLASEA